MFIDKLNILFMYSYALHLYQFTIWSKLIWLKPVDYKPNHNHKLNDSRIENSDFPCKFLFQGLVFMIQFLFDEIQQQLFIEENEHLTINHTKVKNLTIWIGYKIAK